MAVPGEDEILVQLPDVDDPARVKNIMQSTALLELKLVDSRPLPKPGCGSSELRWSHSSESGTSAFG